MTMCIVKICLQSNLCKFANYYFCSYDFTQHKKIHVSTATFVARPPLKSSINFHTYVVRHHATAPLHPLTGALAPPTVYLNELTPNIHITVADGNTHKSACSSARVIL